MIRGEPLPIVSCVCLTFGRPSRLEEAIESFLRQDYTGESELIVVNDFPNQNLVCRADPRVHIINCAARFDSLGAKRNFAIRQAAGSVIVTWDDDDISLPARIPRAVDALRSGIHFFRPSWSWIQHGEKAPELRFRRISWPQCAYSLEAFHRAGGYPDIASGEDKLFAERLAAAGYSTDFTPGDPADALLIYRMLPDNPHAAGISLGRYTYADIQKRLQPGAPQGRIELQPGWRRDYAALCQPAGHKGGPAPSVEAVIAPAVPSNIE